MKMMLIKALGFYLNVLAFVSPARAGQKGFLLFCRPYRLPLNQKQREFFNTADRFMLEVDGHVVQGYRWGRGPRKVLFLHGWQSHTYRWKPYIEALDKNAYTIYSIDAPGHGMSGGNFLSVPLYSDLIEKSVEQFGGLDAVVAHSLGSFSLLYTLHRKPLLALNRVVLMAPPGEANDFISVFQKTLGVSKRTLRHITAHFVNRYEVGPEFFSTSRFAASLNVRGLIIHDEEDVEAPYHYSIPLQKSWSRSRLVTTKGFGHNLRSSSVVKEVVDFIEEHQQHPVLS